MMREGNNVGRPPLFEGSNFSYWKARMRAFVSSIDEQAWYLMENEWQPPVTRTADGRDEPIPRPQWNESQKRDALSNGRALNALFAAMDEDNFKLIAHCVTAKEAWDILHTTHEGTSKVKVSRIQMLTAKFESMRMNEDETITEFHGRLKDLANESASLGEVMSNEKLVRKMLMSLTPSFEMKVTAIEESKDVTKLPLDELIGSLKVFEMKMARKQEKKPRNMGLKSEVENEDTESSLMEEFAMFTKRFGRFVKNANGQRTDQRNRGTKTDRRPRQENTQRPKQKFEDSKDLENQIQCRECRGFGHIQAECANTLKKKKLKKALVTTLSDTDEELSGEEEEEVVALVSLVENDDLEKQESDLIIPIEKVEDPATDSQSSDSELDEEPTDEDVREKLTELFEKWNKAVAVNTKLIKDLSSMKKLKVEQETHIS